MYGIQLLGNYLDHCEYIISNYLEGDQPPKQFRLQGSVLYCDVLHFGDCDWTANHFVFHLPYVSDGLLIHDYWVLREEEQRRLGIPSETPV